MGTKKLAYIGIFIAIGIVFSRFLTIQTATLKVGFGFIPEMLASSLFGPLAGGFINGMVDLIGAIVFPKGGSYFPGFTLSAFLGGAIYGIFLYKKEINIKNILIPTIIVTVLINLGLNTLWLTILTGKGFLVLLPARILKELVMVPVEVLTFRAVYYYLNKSRAIEKAMI